MNMNPLEQAKALERVAKDIQENNRHQANDALLLRTAARTLRRFWKLIDDYQLETRYFDVPDADEQDTRPTER